MNKLISEIQQGLSSVDTIEYSSVQGLEEDIEWVGGGSLYNRLLLFLVLIAGSLYIILAVEVLRGVILMLAVRWEGQCKLQNKDIIKTAIYAL